MRRNETRNKRMYTFSLDVSSQFSPNTSPSRLELHATFSERLLTSSTIETDMEYP